MESIQSNTQLIELDLRSTDCGIANQFYVNLRLRHNRRRLYARRQHRHIDGEEDGDAEPDGSSTSGISPGMMSSSSRMTATGDVPRRSVTSPSVE
jgi:hypothetical protein